MLPGVYLAKKKDGTIYYRSSITYHNKHISLGSYPSEEEASMAYSNASDILYNNDISLQNYTEKKNILSFEKMISLINFRDNGLYISNPIYLKKGYFVYYLSKEEEFKFDIEDLFYYANHKIIRRKGHLFVNDYGMQITILSRYGIKSHAVPNRDYVFINNDAMDYRYSNIKVLNPYYGVSQTLSDGNISYHVQFHINGYYKIGSYSSLECAAVAYNKAIDLARQYGVSKNYSENYIPNLSASKYAEIYTSVSISEKYTNYLKGLSH